jgi:thiamine biosynthesis protein ThiS
LGAALEISVNGQAREVPDGSTVGDLILALEIEPRRVAVEVNLELVPREQHADHQLAPGDRLEVVTLVGGG